jgi:hypothetical protein
VCLWLSFFRSLHLSCLCYSCSSFAAFSVPHILIEGLRPLTSSLRSHRQSHQASLQDACQCLMRRLDKRPQTGHSRLACVSGSVGLCLTHTACFGFVDRRHIEEGSQPAKTDGLASAVVAMLHTGTEHKRSHGLGGAFAQCAHRPLCLNSSVAFEPSQACRLTDILSCPCYHG